MGMIASIGGAFRLAMKFFGGSGAANLADVVEVFQPNAEAQSKRNSDHQFAALAQFGQEFTGSRKGLFSGFVDGLNRLPRPMMAFGVLALFVYCFYDPTGFGEVMKGLALVPDPLWIMLSLIASFYFGAREFHHMRAKGVRDGLLEIKSSMPELLALPAPDAPDDPGRADPGSDVKVSLSATEPDFNPALAAWKVGGGLR